LTLVSQPLLCALPSQFPYPELHAIAHAPWLQEGVPWFALQVVVQLPQFETLVCVLVSQPLAGLPSQSPQPASHVLSWQVPVAQLSEACARLHWVPQEMQSESVFRLVSQPLLGLPSQLSQPPAQSGAQAPDMQDVVPFGFVHALVHEPQLVSVLSALSQPFDALPSQLP